MTTQRTPCQENNTVSREFIDRIIAKAEHRLAANLALGQTPGIKERVRKIEEDLRNLRALQHPDDWFIDPGSGRDTVDGRRRRRALQACWSDCPVRARLRCLDMGLQGPESAPNLNYGIYGGYTEEQRQQIYAEIQRRKGGRAT